MDREKFINIMSLCSIGIFIPLISCEGEINDFDRILSFPASISNIFDEDQIVEIGNVYLKQHSNVFSKSELQKEILNHSNEANLEVIFYELSQKIKEDFRIGMTIVIEGWILSKTEAQQCALFSLDNN
jgi:hypothetical protein